MKKLLIVGTLLMSLIAQANIFSNEEYSKYQILLNEEQQEQFEEIFWRYDLEIERNKRKIELLEIENNSKVGIWEIIQDTKDIVLDKKLELEKLENDFFENPQRYNVTIKKIYD